MKKRWSSLIVAVALAIGLGRTPGLDASSAPSFQQGVSYAAAGHGAYSSSDADLSLANLVSTGADWISLIVTGYQDSPTSTTILSTANTASDADLVHAIQRAHSLGLRVMLKPHVDVLNPPGTWRGTIGRGFASETQWGDWFASYRRFIERYAALAQTYGVEQFCAGTELTGTTARAADWRAVVAGVRARYTGQITYAANHGGEETGITWWDAVDVIGVDAYYPLSDHDDPTLTQLKSGWAGPLSTLAGLSASWGKSILLTEIGYRSQAGASRHPWDWSSTGRVDLQEQANAYQSAFDSLSGQPWLAGLFWWVWDTDPFQGGACDVGYSPYDKPAENILRAGYGAPGRIIPIPSPAPDYSRTLDIYRDALAAGWQDWSWDNTHNLSSSDQSLGGTRSISVTLRPFGGLSFWHPAFNTESYYYLEFYVRASAAGEPSLSSFFYADDGTELRKRPVNDCRYVDGGTLAADTWKRVNIPLRDLNADARSVTRVALQDSSGQGSPLFWVDEMRLVAARWRVLLPLATR